MRPNSDITRHGRVAPSTFQVGSDGCAFELRAPAGVVLRVIASTGAGWDHVSAHAYEAGKMRIPTWLEMSMLYRVCFNTDETAMQLHVPEHDHVNVHSSVLHLWRPQFGAIPRPPAELV